MTSNQRIAKRLSGQSWPEQKQSYIFVFQIFHLFTILFLQPTVKPSGENWKILESVFVKYCLKISTSFPFMNLNIKAQERFETSLNFWEILTCPTTWAPFLCYQSIKSCFSAVCPNCQVLIFCYQGREIMRELKTLSQIKITRGLTQKCIRDKSIVMNET